MLPFQVEGTGSDIEAWLASDSEWATPLRKYWKGNKFLGRGGYGVAGLWEYVGPDSPPLIQQIVVKQTVRNIDPLDVDMGEIGPSRSPLSEGIIGKKLDTAKSNHIVRQFGRNKLGSKFRELNYVVTLFLEFCPGGDLDQFLPRNQDEIDIPPPLLDEEDMWSIFNCMALGIAVMGRGAEDSQQVAWPGKNPNIEIMHGDLKPDNVFLGIRDSLNHPRIPVGKIADFGESIEVDAIHLQNNEYGSRFTDRGAPYYKPPEENIRWRGSPWNLPPTPSSYPIFEPRKGTCSNVWQVGAIMNSLMLRERLNFNPSPREGNLIVSRSNLIGTLNLHSGFNHSIRLEKGPAAMKYSIELRALVQECLLREPLKRPDIADLTERTRNGLAAATQRAIRTSPQARFLNSPIQSIGTGRPEPPLAWDDHHQLAADNTFVLVSPSRSLLRKLQGIGQRVRNISNSSWSTFSSVTGFSGSLPRSNMFSATGSSPKGTGSSSPITSPFQPGDQADLEDMMGFSFIN